MLFFSANLKLELWKYFLINTNSDEKAPKSFPVQSLLSKNLTFILDKEEMSRVRAMDTNTKETSVGYKDWQGRLVTRLTVAEIYK